MKGKKLKILVVDDEAGVRDLITYLLESMGYIIRTAKDGLEAVEIVANEEFDIIFLDVHMPNMKGTEALESIKKIRPKQTVIIFSSSSDPYYVFESQAKQKGAFDCLYKPFELDDLLNVINKAVNNKVN
ncbi:MAG: response regulator [Endomicrobiales bacterium]|nr:response regulator [Endomicrobiales bacterium]